MKNVLTSIFITLGVIFFILILIAGYFFVTDPYNLKPLIFGSDSETIEKKPSEEVPGAVVSGGFTLSESQKQALVSVGIDPASVPSSISVEQESCFVGYLGADRVAEIKAGAVPNALEFMKVKPCI